MTEKWVKKYNFICHLKEGRESEVLILIRIVFQKGGEKLKAGLPKSV